MVIRCKNWKFRNYASPLPCACKPISPLLSFPPPKELLKSSFSIGQTTKFSPFSPLLQFPLNETRQLDEMRSLIQSKREINKKHYQMIIITLSKRLLISMGYSFQFDMSSIAVITVW